MHIFSGGKVIFFVIIFTKRILNRKGIKEKLKLQRIRKFEEFQKNLLFFYNNFIALRFDL